MKVILLELRERWDNMGGGNSGLYSGTKGSNIKLPDSDSQLKHIFCDKEGHLRDTSYNRKLIKDLANNKNFYKGKDKYGNSWNIKIDSKGRQLWVRYMNGKINEGGRNNVPIEWDDEIGLNKNPFKKGGR